jgi:hypothetical protein
LTKFPDPSNGVTEAMVTPAGSGFGNPICSPVEGQSPRLSRILTDLTDVTINCSVFKHHNLSGVTAAMKNIYGMTDSPVRFHNNLNTALPKLYALPQIRNSISLTIVDALVSVTVGDTADPLDFSPSRIFLAQDPVALDSYALVLLNEIRAAMANAHPIAIQPIAPSLTAWLANAAAAGLGSTNYSLVQA